jgi:hypothetical protein
MKHELAQLADKIDWRHYDSDDIDGVNPANPATGLAEGQTFTFPDGTTVTRLGDWAVRRTPKETKAKLEEEPASP